MTKPHTISNKHRKQWINIACSLAALNKIIVLSLLLCSSTLINASTPENLARLHEGEILFNSLQGKHFDALITLQNRFSPGRLSSNDLLLNFGLSNTVENNLNTKPANENKTRNHDIYQLAKFYLNRQQPLDAIHTLNTIDDKNSNTRDDTHYRRQQLKALAYMQAGNFKSAKDILQKTSSNTNNINGAYIQYNLGITQLQSNNTEEGISTLTALAKSAAQSKEQLALKDRTNLQLGEYYLDTGKSALAREHFSRVSRNSPYTGQALLGIGWSSFSLAEIERAIIPWTVLHTSKTFDKYHIEALMALPYAYAKLGAHGKAANLYGNAVEVFDSELSNINRHISDIKSGKLSKTILDAFTEQDKQWLINFISSSISTNKYNLTLLYDDTSFRQLANALHDLAILENVIKQKLSDTTTTINSADKTSDQLSNKYIKRIKELNKRLINLNRKLDSIIEDGKQKLESVSVEILHKEQVKLENYRNNALFALAESYDFATRKQK